MSVLIEKIAPFLMCCPFQVIWKFLQVPEQTGSTSCVSFLVDIALAQSAKYHICLLVILGRVLKEKTLLRPYLYTDRGKKLFY
jgi:hypothetical protein